MMYHKHFLRICALCLVATFLLPTLGCARSSRKLRNRSSRQFVDYNYPYEPDTPAPAPHEGTFISAHGTMTFNGDGRSVVIEFDKALADAVGLPAGKHEMLYEFLSGDLAPHGKIPVRYDTAMYISIYAGEGASDRSNAIAVGIVNENGSKSTGTGCTTAECITFIDIDLDGTSGVNFIKSAAAKDGDGLSAPASNASAGMSEKKQRELAAFLSTDDKPNEKEFDWFVRRAYARKGTAAYKAAPAESVRIDSMPLLLNGGWKCFSCGEDSRYTGTDARLLNADLKTDGKSVILKLHWWRVLNPSVEGIEDESDMPATVCNGKWDAKNSSVHFVADIGNVDLTDFYISRDENAEYAVGTLTWSSGEEDHFAMMRSLPKKSASRDALMIKLAKKHSGAPEAALEWNPDGTATIHLFETVDDGDGDSHISTWDWYTIDPATMTGTDFMEMPVDLNSAGQ